MIRAIQEAFTNIGLSEKERRMKKSRSVMDRARGPKIMNKIAMDLIAQGDHSVIMYRVQDDDGFTDNIILRFGLVEHEGIKSFDQQTSDELSEAALQSKGIMLCSASNGLVFVAITTAESTRGFRDIATFPRTNEALLESKLREGMSISVGTQDFRYKKRV